MAFIEVNRNFGSDSEGSFDVQLTVSVKLDPRYISYDASDEDIKTYLLNRMLTDIVGVTSVS